MAPPKPAQKSYGWRLRPRERRPLLFAGDLIVAFLSLAGSLYLWGIRDVEWLGFSREFLVARVPMWFYFIPFVWLVLIVELYDLHRAGNIEKTRRGIAVSALIGLVLYSLIYITYTRGSLPRIGVAYFLAIVSPATLFWRFFYIRIFTAPAFMRRVLIVGGGKAGSTLLHVVNDLRPAPFFVAGIVDDDPQKIGTEIEGCPVMGGADCLPITVENENVSDIIVAISGRMGGRMFQALLDIQESGIEITRMQTIYEDLLGRVPIFHLEADWILRSYVESSRVSGFYSISKRLLDIAGGITGVLLFLLVLPFVGIANLLESGRPVFYTQTRSGRGDHPYKVVKFRTMLQDAEKDGIPQWTKENDERVTRVGRFLRKTHLDELPQFLNVLRGEMSLVGPRPERPELITLFQKYVPFYRARLLVKPGITGWAQIHQEYAANVEETYVKLEYDLYYIKRRNLLLDLVILLRTPATILGFRGR
ncbi:MAG: exopolysaccharide biosynthesis polyprenyl glycosylphosphotransferase [Anaerolineales bacterium]